MVADLAGIADSDQAVAEQVNLRDKPYTICRGHGSSVSFDQIKDRHAIEDLNGSWGCKLLRVLSYKLYKSGD